jgi:abnormal spindle-like microcephaly-associated protein
LQSLELKIVMSSILKLQRWWRGVLLLKHRAKSAILVQSHVRGWIGRKKASRERQRVVVVQVRLIDLCYYFSMLHFHGNKAGSL